MTRLLAAIVAVIFLAPSHAHAERRGLVDYMAFGDSFTSGIGTSDPATMSYPAQAGIPGVGVHGTDTVGLRQWWTPYLDGPTAPATAVVLVGLGDLVLHQRTARETIAGLRALKRDARTHGVRVVFGTLPPFVAGSAWARHDPARLAVNTWVRGRATFVDYAPALTCGSYLCPDFIGAWNDLHPNDAGAGAMAAVLRAWMLTDRLPR